MLLSLNYAELFRTVAVLLVSIPYLERILMLSRLMLLRSPISVRSPPLEQLSKTSPNHVSFSSKNSLIYELRNAKVFIFRLITFSMLKQVGNGPSRRNI